MKDRSSFYAIGLMSGSSLDGLDIAYCKFQFAQGQWTFDLLQAKTVKLDAWESMLRNAVRVSEDELDVLSNNFAQFMAAEVVQFMQEKEIQEVDVLVSHGHTIYHYPEKGITCQIGNGQILADKTGLTVVNNLRQKDIDVGGQGAPIVPIGDLHLFKAYKLCLNLGGIANVSVESNNELIAFDICPANQVLNYYAELLGKPYDDKGGIAASGNVNAIVLSRLNKHSYYSKKFPKSLDNGTSKEFIQLINQEQLSAPDALRTFTEHIAVQVKLALMEIAQAQEIPITYLDNMLVTGGGAFNNFLIDCLQQKLEVNVEVPSANLVNYKEAIVMAFIGVLRLRNEVNVLATVTGAKVNTSCGDIYLPQSKN